MTIPKAADEDKGKTTRRSALTRLLRLRASPNAHPDEMRDALRNAHSQFGSIVNPTELSYFLRTYIDMAVSVPGHGIFLSGWLVDPDTITTAMFLELPDGRISDNFASQIVSVPRGDVTKDYKLYLGSQNKPGFLCFVRMSDLPDIAVNANFILCTSSGKSIEVPFSIQAGMDPLNAVRSIVRQIPVNSQSLLPVLDKHVGPAVEALWATRQTSNPHVSIETYGRQVDKPRWTIIVPLRSRSDLIRYQLSQFADDPDFRKTELLYVVDDPKILDAVLNECAGIHPIFGVPFKVLYSGFNLGYGVATNLGAAHSHAETLVLLKPEVLPAHSGWLERLEQQRLALPNPGAVGPKLLYEDGSIQHAGMCFGRHPLYEELWTNECLGKGQPDWILSDTTPVHVPAITGACLMLDRSLYENVGGFDEGFILGDYEDSDLCLKLIQVGRTNYYVPNVELYHLEPQPNRFGGSDYRTPKITIYNCWQHTRKWDSQIKMIAEQFND